MKKIVFTLLFLLISYQAHAFEDCVITTDEKLTDIEIEDNSVVDVHPLITIMNDKNTIVVHPLKEGVTYFSVKKGKKEKHVFYVKVSENETIVSQREGFEVFNLDSPPPSFELDLPPTKVNEDIDEPPVLRKKVSD